MGRLLVTYIGFTQALSIVSCASAALQRARSAALRYSGRDERPGTCDLLVTQVLAVLCGDGTHTVHHKQ